MKLVSTLVLVLLAACATSSGGARQSAGLRKDLVAVARAMTAIDAAERKGDEILAERQRRSDAADSAPEDAAARYLAVYAQPHGEDRWAAFKRVSVDFPESALGQLGMASVYVEWKTLDQADRAIVAALEIEPDSWLAVRWRAEVAEIRGQLDAAAQDYRTVLDEDPKNAESLLGLARIAQKQGNAAAARKSADAALAVAPDLFGARALLADLAIAAGDRQEAVAQLSKAVAASPRDRGARMSLAKLLRQGGDAAGARDHWRAAVMLKEDAESLASLAEAANAAKDSKTELQAIEKLTALDPSAAEWRRVAEIRLEAQDWDGAEKALKRALARDPHDKGANAGLGKVRLHRGESQEAVESLRAAGDAAKDELAALERRINLERLSQRDVLLLQKAVQALVDRTYRARLAQAPSLSGDLTLRATVAAAGAASLVEVIEDSIHDGDVRACAYWNLRDAAYPPNKPGRYTFKFSFRR